ARGPAPDESRLRPGWTEPTSRRGCMLGTVRRGGTGVASSPAPTAASTPPRCMVARGHRVPEAGFEPATDPRYERGALPDCATPAWSFWTVFLYTRVTPGPC